MSKRGDPSKPYSFDRLPEGATPLDKSDLAYAPGEFMTPVGHLAQAWTVGGVNDDAWRRIGRGGRPWAPAYTGGRLSGPTGCIFDGCTNPVPFAGGKGRPPTYCPEHRTPKHRTATFRKRRQQKRERR